MAELATRNKDELAYSNDADQARPAAGAGGSAPGYSQKSAAVGSNTPAHGDYFKARSETTRRLRNAKVAQSELILFATQLSVMLDSGVLLSDALDAIVEQLKEGNFKVIIMDVCNTVKSGENFSRPLADYPRIFSSMFVSMVKASEASGKMANMLTVLSGYLSFESETRKRIKGALTYPIIMASMAVVATGTLMFFVLPRFMKIYEAKGAALPKITQMLVSFNKILSDSQSLTLLLTTITFISMALYFWAGTLVGRRVIDYLKIRVPIIGRMFVDMVVTRSMRIMTTMVNTGVSLLDAVKVMQTSSDNYYFQQLWESVDEKIREGYQLSESIQMSVSGEHSPSGKVNTKAPVQLIEPGTIAMLRAGEKGGKLGEVSEKISVFYEKRFEASIKTVTALIEPLMLAVLGAVIGIIAIALLLPVFKISTVIAH